MKGFIGFVCICALIIFGALFSYCSSPNKMATSINDTIYIRDTVTIKETVYVDTINSIVDSLQEELFVAKYKLERIRYYNNIAKNGNNIKYLRGWINRVLND